jgi:hypothetical protein
MPVYDKEFYKKRCNPRSVDAFLDFEKELEKTVARKRWNLTPEFNAYYAGFNHGFWIAFGVHWIGCKSFEVFAKLTRSLASRAKRLCPYPSEYDEPSKTLAIRVTEDVKPRRLTPLLQVAYDSVVAEHPTR